MTWIKMRADLWEDPRTARIAQLLEVPLPHAIGLLHRFWSWADKMTADGFVPHATATFIDEHVASQGFAQALDTVGWFEECEGGIRIPRFEEHNGRSAKRRATEAKRKQAERSSSPHHVRSLSASETDIMRTVCGPEQTTTIREDQTIEKTTASTAAVDLVIKLLGSDTLLLHQNATPERLKWIAEVAPTKQNPGGWAAEAIRKAWKPPANFSDRQAKIASEAARRAAAAWLQSLPLEQSRSVEHQIVQRHPQLATCTDAQARDAYLLDKIVDGGLHLSKGDEATT